ncbi:MAG: hypothetical protein CSA34_00660 [Desulfobulbus propionicus]|nr:MAG: hypothetical protein CSA34_00660 [Desulfobulbus propionicus]
MRIAAVNMLKGPGAVPGLFLSRARRVRFHRLWLMVFMTVVVLLQSEQALADQQIRLPMFIDMPLLRSLVAEQFFTEPGEQATVVNLSDGCNRVLLSEPMIGEERHMIRLQTKVRIDWGTPIGGKCFAPLSWEGQVALWQEPVITPEWQLRFSTKDSSLLDMSDRPIRLADLFWNLVKEHVHRYLGDIVVDLAPPVLQLKEMLLPQFTADRRAAAIGFLESMQPSGPSLEDGQLRVDILARVPDVQRLPEEEQHRVEASPKSLERLLELWETWDALLVYLIGQLSDKPLTDDDRQLLLDTTLSMRYEISRALEAGGLTDSLIREQFVGSWNALKPLFRNHLGGDSDGNLLGYLSFFTAVDALAVLDTIGPAIGLEISSDGLHRLAVLLDGGMALEPVEEVNPALRRAFGLGEPLEEGSSEVPVDEDRLPSSDTREGSSSDRDETGQPQTLWLPWMQHFFQYLPGVPAVAWAAPPSMEEIRGWTARIVPASQLLPAVQKVLERAGARMKGKLQLQTITQEWLDRMILATAWQESCFRQFTVKNKKLTYLLSYNKSSVGLMQVNEKVWRGLYNRQELRWNIHYNARAGVEILTLYLNRYIARYPVPVKLTDKKGQRFLAAWLYTLYNGGPSQLKKFIARHAAGNLYQSEKLFLEKYDQSGSSDWMNQVDCLPRI